MEETLLRAWVVTLLFWLALAVPAWAENRVALVIGNDRYDELTAGEQLHNAVNDARALKATLEQLKFGVDLGENLDRKQFVEKLSDFVGKLQPDDIAFFFFAGHGVSFSGANYMLPRDIPRPRANARAEESRLADLALAEANVVARIHGSGARIAVVVLDACRDNPLAPSGGRSIGGERGLQPPPETRGVLTIYSAGAGQKATDLGDGNSLFTSVLVKALKTPGLGLRDVAFRTQSEVAALAGKQGLVQEPGVYSQIIGDDVYLAGRPVEAAPAADDSLAKLVDEASPEALQALIVGLPEGALKGRAKARAEKLKGTQMASLAPEIAVPPSLGAVETVRPAPDPVELARALQVELKRVGCDPGTTDGVWGPATEHALALFNIASRTSAETRFPTGDAVELLRRKKERVCKLECGRETIASGDACIPKAKPQAIMIKPVVKPTPVVKIQKPDAGAAPVRRKTIVPKGRGCFEFNGSSVC